MLQEARRTLFSVTRTANLERGFWRVTWVMSVVLFLTGAAVTARHAWQEVDGWLRAGGPAPDGPPIVYAFGNLAQFGAGSTPHLIREEIDGMLAGAKKLLKESPALAGVKKAHPALSNEDAAQFLAISRWVERRRPTDRRGEMPADPVSFVYVGPKDVPSAVYSRRALLHAEAQGELSGAAEAGLVDLRKRYGFSGPVTKPFSLDVFRFLGLTIVAGALPWGLFLFGRWIAYGFKLNAPAEARPDTPGAHRLAAAGGGSVMARFYYVVSRNRPDLYDLLRQEFRSEHGMQVIIDRRFTDQRRRDAGWAAERRSGDRRTQDIDIGQELLERGCTIVRRDE